MSDNTVVYKMKFETELLTDFDDQGTQTQNMYGNDSIYIRYDQIPQYLLRNNDNRQTQTQTAQSDENIDYDSSLYTNLPKVS